MIVPQVSRAFPQRLGVSDSPSFTGLSITGLTTGSVPYISTSRVVAQDNNNLYFDSSNSKLHFDRNNASAVGSLTHPKISFGSGSYGIYKASATALTIVANATDVLTANSTGRINMPVTGSSAGLNIGGDTLIYRVSTATLRSSSTLFEVIGPTFTATSGSQRSLYAQAYNNPSGASSARTWAFVFYAEAQGSSNLTDNTSCIVGVEGTVVNNNSATVTAMSGGIFFNSFAANSTTTRFAGLDVYGPDVSGSAGTGATVTDGMGIILRNPRSSGNTSLGNITGFFNVQLRATTWSGTGHVTSHIGFGYSSGGTLTAITANSQTRKFIEVPAMPTPSSFTSLTNYGVDFLGTSRAARDGIRIAGDCDLYSGAANIFYLGTGDSLLTDTALISPLFKGNDVPAGNGQSTILRAGQGTASKGGVGGSVSIYAGSAETAGSVSVYKVNGSSRLTQWNETGIGFFAATPAAQQTSGANLTNNVTSGGTDDTIANFTDLSTYSNDSAAIRNNIYQLARKLKQVNDGLRSYGLLT